MAESEGVLGEGRLPRGSSEFSRARSRPTFTRSGSPVVITNSPLYEHRGTAKTMRRYHEPEVPSIRTCSYTGGSSQNAGLCIRELLAALRQDPQQLSRGLHPALGSGVYGLRGEAVRPGVSVPRCRRFSRSPGPRRRPGGDRRAWGDHSGSLSHWQDPPLRTPTASASWTPPLGSSSPLSRPAAIPIPWWSFLLRNLSSPPSRSLCVKGIAESGVAGVCMVPPGRGVHIK